VVVAGPIATTELRLTFDSSAEPPPRQLSNGGEPWTFDLRLPHDGAVFRFETTTMKGAQEARVAALDHNSVVCGTNRARPMHPANVEIATISKALAHAP
jgi:hypothetical protein